MSLEPELRSDHLGPSAGLPSAARRGCPAWF